VTGIELHPDARSLLESDRLAHFVTLNPDGSPQVSCIWVGLDGDEIVSGHLPRNQKVKNCERQDRVAYSIEGERLSESGLREYLVVHGKARVQEGGAAELLQRLAHVYLGPDVKFPPMDDPPAGYVIRTTPERLGGVGPWSGRSH
jgi:PPOX class probable F420-dependent enzyme